MSLSGPAMRRATTCLNVVRSGRPEQSLLHGARHPEARRSQCSPVWKTGTMTKPTRSPSRLWMPSQCSPVWKTGTIAGARALGVRGVVRLNVVRSGRPEQLSVFPKRMMAFQRSQCSPVWKTGTMAYREWCWMLIRLSQCSPVWKTGTIYLHHHGREC